MEKSTAQMKPQCVMGDLVVCSNWYKSIQDKDNTRIEMIECSLELRRQNCRRTSLTLNAFRRRFLDEIKAVFNAGMIFEKEYFSAIRFIRMSCKNIKY